jgi:hypothetical protein
MHGHKLMHGHKPLGAAPRPSVAAAMAQLSQLLRNGFLEGQGAWRKPLFAQLDVLSLLDHLYSSAEYVDAAEEMLA